MNTADLDGNQLATKKSVHAGQTPGINMTSEIVSRFHTTTVGIITSQWCSCNTAPVVVQRKSNSTCAAVADSDLNLNESNLRLGDENCLIVNA
mmetsp:Transcript_39918/g.120193  ORF Transcript_39918/g.120193 Transcript_39918/m.120193 type:complete len:93 (+) Transcript_39918:203-481(+)